jgi:hypothetical protein
MTYNVKTASDVLKMPVAVIYDRCRKLRIEKEKVDFGYCNIWTYVLDEQDLKLIKQLPRKKKESSYAKIAQECGLKKRQVKSIANKVKKYSRKNHSKLKKACELWKTKLYTTKGIAHFCEL